MKTVYIEIYQKNYVFIECLCKYSCCCSHVDSVLVFPQYTGNVDVSTKTDPWNNECVQI